MNYLRFMVMMINIVYIIIVFLFVLLVIIDIRKELKIKREEANKIQKEKETLQKEIKRISGIIREEVNKGEILGGDSRMVLENNNNLGQLLEVKAEQEDYDLALAMLIKEVQGLYKDFKFKLLKPQTGDYLSGYAITFEISDRREGSTLRELFKRVIAKNMSEGKLADLFVEEVKNGNVIEIGDVILDEYATGMSSLVTGEPVTVVISFETEEYKVKRKEQEEEQKAEAEKQKEKQENLEKLRVEAHKAITEASVILKEMSKEIVEAHPEYVEAYEKVRELYK